MQFFRFDICLFIKLRQIYKKFHYPVPFFAIFFIFCSAFSQTLSLLAEIEQESDRKILSFRKSCRNPTEKRPVPD